MFLGRASRATLALIQPLVVFERLKISLRTPHPLQITAWMTVLTLLSSFSQLGTLFCRRAELEKMPCQFGRTAAALSSVQMVPFQKGEREQTIASETSECAKRQAMKHSRSMTPT